MTLAKDLLHHGWADADKHDLFSFVLDIESLVESSGVNVDSTATIAQSASISGNVTIEKEVQILEGAVIKGPCHIGQRSIIGSFSLVRGPTIIGRDAILGNHSYLTNCFLGHYARVTHFCGVSRSLVGRNACLSTFVNTPTLRADRKKISIESKEDIIDYDKIGSIIGKDAYIAPHVMIMPGVRIGEGSFVGSFLIVESDLEPKTHIRCEQSILRKPFDRNFPEVTPNLINDPNSDLSGVE